MNWDELDIKKEIALGEDSTRQFKRNLESAAKLAEEMCALSNSQGGIIYVGVADDYSVTGLTQKEIGQYNQFISNASNENIRPAIYPQTKIVDLDGKLVLLINVSQGPAKPYCTSSGVYYVKSGSDKRKSSPQELARMFQQSSFLSMDESLTSAEIIISGEDKTVDLAKFYVFYEKSRGKVFTQEGIPVDRTLGNMNLAREGKLTLGGLLLFGDNPQKFKPFCIIRAVSYYGNEISDDRFKDRNDCAGALEEQYRAVMNFLKNNLSNIQKEGSFNQTGSLEIDERALEEVVVNALLHRDYSKNAVVRLLIFENRVEIVSPGSLPNHLTVDNIINGNSVIRNPILVSFATKILPYSGIGSGIARILKNHPQTKFVDDKNGEQFTTILYRPKK